METKEVIKKHEKKFNRVKMMIKVILVVVLASVIALQWSNIIQLVSSF